MIHMNPLSHFDRYYDAGNKVLNLCGLNLDECDFGEIRLLLVSHTEMEELILKNNCFYGDTIRKILYCVTLHGIKLKRLDLSGNMVGPNGIESIGKYVAGNTELQWLGLSSNRLGTWGGLMLAGYLKEHNSLSYLDVTENNMDDIAGISIVINMSTCNILSRICIAHGNRCGEMLKCVVERLNMQNYVE